MATNSAITKGINSISNKKVFTVNYENFCQNPQCLLDEICQRWQIKAQSQIIDLPKYFEISKNSRVKSCDWNKIVSEIKNLL